MVFCIGIIVRAALASSVKQKAGANRNGLPRPSQYLYLLV